MIHKSYPEPQSRNVFHPRLFITNVNSAANYDKNDRRSR